MKRYLRFHEFILSSENMADVYELIVDGKAEETLYGQIDCISSERGHPPTILIPLFGIYFPGQYTAQYDDINYRIDIEHSGKRVRVTISELQV